MKCSRPGCEVVVGEVTIACARDLAALEKDTRRELVRARTRSGPRSIMFRRALADAVLEWAGPAARGTLAPVG